MAKEILCAYGVDVDVVGGGLGSYGGADSPKVDVLVPWESGQKREELTTMIDVALLVLRLVTLGTRLPC